LMGGEEDEEKNSTPEKKEDINLGGGRFPGASKGNSVKARPLAYNLGVTSRTTLPVRRRRGGRGAG